MEDEREKLRSEVALFRYGLVSDLVHLEPGGGDIYRRLREKSELDYRIPGSQRVRVAVETMRDWLKLYRKGGFDALLPQVRRDSGLTRALPREVCDLLIGIKEERPDLSVGLTIDQARASGQVPADLALPPSTVHRMLVRAGVMEKPRRGESSNDRRRFAFEKAGELWMSDVMHGPAVVSAGRQKHRAYLIALLDDATRVIPYAAFAPSENTQAYLPVLRGALERRGIPMRLYVDNGAAYRSHQLALVCAKLGITLIHTRPYDAAAKGKQERWFRTVRMQFLPLLSTADVQSHDALNRKLWAWIEGEYHHAPHRGLGGETPLDRWARSADEVRYVAPELDLDDLMLWEEKRRVQKDRTVSLHGVVYEVDAALVGSTVTLRFDPARAKRSVQVCKDGKPIAEAKPVDLYANCFVRRERPSRTLLADAPPSAPRPGVRLSELRERKDRDDKEKS